MKEIQLIYAKNIVSRSGNRLKQELEFFILVGNFAFQKQVDVFWAGEDGAWRTLKAEYVGVSGRNREIWRAHVVFEKTSRTSLPGCVQFALRYRVMGAEYWDNNNSWNYSIEADSGVKVREGVPLLNIEFNPSLNRGQKLFPVVVAVHRHVDPKRVFVHWTTNGWTTVHRTPCSFQRYYWHQAARSNVENPNQYGWLIWTGQLAIENAYRVEYAISCDTDRGTIWDNNLGSNYVSRRDRLSILTLNLHCYQENDQDEKFARIAGAINDLNVDIICLQEVCENWNHGQGDWKSNSARIIKERLKKSYYLSYHLYTDWSHIGFGKYREGVAILSKYKFRVKNSGYVSSIRDIGSIHSRKVVMAQVHVPYLGLVNVYSVHLSWWDDGFREQFDNLRKWADWESGDDVVATFLCGDFNIKAGSQGYAFVVASKRYDDQFLEVTSEAVFHRIFRQLRPEWEKDLVGDHRIDFIFKDKRSKLKVVSSRVLFTDCDYGRVSDHSGYFAEFEPI